MWFIMKSCIYIELCRSTTISWNKEYFHSEVVQLKQIFAPCTWNQYLSTKSISISMYLQITWRQKSFSDNVSVDFKNHLYLTFYNKIEMYVVVVWQSKRYYYLYSLIFSLGIFITNLWSSSYEKSGKSISRMDSAGGKTFVHARAWRNCDLFFRLTLRWQCHRPWYFNRRRRKERRGK